MAYGTSSDELFPEFFYPIFTGADGSFAASIFLSRHFYDIFFFNQPLEYNTRSNAC